MNVPQKSLMFVCLSIAAVCLWIPVSGSNAQSSRYIIYFGTTAGPEGKGVYACTFDPAAVRFGSVSRVAEIERASWVTLHPNHRYLYAVSETGNDGKTDGEVFSFAIDSANGSLKLLNRISSGGGGATHLAIDRNAKTIAVANYGGGRVTVFRLNPDGSIGERTALVQHTGSSVHPTRQTSSHPHGVVLSPDDRFLFVPDLGTDKIYSYLLNAANGSLAPNNPAFTPVPPGSGPRHFVFHPQGRFAYLIQQMESRISAYSYDAVGGSLAEIQSVRTRPEDFSGDNTGAEIVMGWDGRFLYASNRGDDSLVVFAVDQAKGTLTKVQRVPTMGKLPRSFSIDPTGRFLFAANQDSSIVVVFQINASTGELSPTGKSLSVPAPVCIAFVPADLH